MSNDTFQEMDPRISFIPNTCLIYKELNLNKNDSEIKWLGLTIGFLYKALVFISSCLYSKTLLQLHLKLFFHSSSHETLFCSCCFFRFATMNRKLLDPYIPNCSTMYPNYWPNYDPKFSKLINPGS